MGAGGRMTDARAVRASLVPLNQRQGLDTMTPCVTQG
jgi:hypothetical protein